MGNAGIVDLGDRTLVFDTMFTPQAATDLRQAAEELTGHPVTYVVNSHEHFDHVHGNQVFSGAQIIATSATRDLIAKKRPAFLQMAREHPEYPDQLARRAEKELDPAKRQELNWLVGDLRALQASLSELEIHPPKVTFEEHLVLEGSARRVEVLCYGGGHSPSDAFVYLPDEQIAFMADLVQVGYHPALHMGNPEEWIQILDQVAELNVQTIVSGHGTICTRQDIQRMREYISHLKSLAAELASQGVQPETVAIPEVYAEWLCPGVFRENLTFLWKQATGAMGPDNR